MGDYNYCLHKNDFLDALFMLPRTPAVKLPRPVDTVAAKADTLEEATIVAETFRVMLPSYIVKVTEVLEGCDYTIIAYKYCEL